MTIYRQDGSKVNFEGIRNVKTYEDATGFFECANCGRPIRVYDAYPSGKLFDSAFSGDHLCICGVCHEAEEFGPDCDYGMEAIGGTD